MSVDDVELSSVKSDKRNVVIPGGHVVKIKGRVKVADLHSTVPAIFEPDECQNWPEELRITEKLVTLHRGQQKINLSVVNTSKHDVILLSNTTLVTKTILKDRCKRNSCLGTVQKNAFQIPVHFIA